MLSFHYMLAIQQLKGRLSQICAVSPENSNKQGLPANLAPILKKLATEHLDNLHNNNFEALQSTELRGTDIEAEALAALLGCHLVVTAVNSKTRDTRIRCITEAEHTDAPIIHLTCVLDPWSYNSKNLGEHGDSLYITMAQALEDFAKNADKKCICKECGTSNLAIKIITEPNERLELYNRLPK